MDGIERQQLEQNDTFYVPHDIIRNILVRLDVKSLLRFKLVSRKWKATISDPMFTQNHVLQSKSIPSHQYIFRAEIDTLDEHATEVFKLVQFNNQEFQVESMLDYPQEFGEADFLCCLDGLLLLGCSKEGSYSIGDWYTHYALWNPSIATFIIFASPNSQGFKPRFYGIYHDPLGECYKVVMGDLTSYYAVFNSKNKCWTHRKWFPNGEKIYRTNPPGVYFNGSLYWVLNEVSTDIYLDYVNFKVVRFDPIDEKFKKVRKPRGMQNKEYPFFLILLGGHLCLYSCSKDQLFIMKKDDERDSWMEYITIKNLPLTSNPWPLFSTKENEIVLDLLNHPSENFIAYNLNEKTFEEIKVLGNVESFLFPFVGSLVLDTRRNRRFRRQEAFEELREVFFLM